MTALPNDAAASPNAAAPRDSWAAMRLGFRGRCPRCSQGTLFRAFLKVRERCEACGEELHHHRADDAPPYVTVLVVAHVIGALMVAVLSVWDLPTEMQLVLWPGLVVAMSLFLLPRVKGALIALQWALRMHGFAGEPDGLPEATGIAGLP